MKKRILALVMSVAMVLGAVSFTAFADTNTGTTYAAGEGAYYLFDVPEAGIDADKHTTSGTTEALTVVNENGENFIKYVNPIQKDADDKLKNYTSSINSAELTYGQTGLPESVVIGKNGTEDLKNVYVAVRLKINDSAPAFKQTAASLGISVVKKDGTTKTLLKNNWQMLRWLDLNDGSMIYFKPQSGYNRNGNNDRVDFTGDMDGYLFIPFHWLGNNAATEKAFEAADFKDVYAGLKFTCFNADEKTADDKATDWIDKELLIGDAFIVNDVEKFASERSDKRGVAGKMYAPYGEDTAYYAARVGGFRSYHYARHDKTTISKDYRDPNLNGGIGSYDTVYHITTLSNGDKAYEFLPNLTNVTPAKPNAYAYLTAADTYDGINLADGGYFDSNGRITVSGGKQGVPDVIDLSKITTIAIRVATKDGTVANETIKFALNISMCKTGASGTEVKYDLLAGDIKYLNIQTGAYETLTVDSSKNITYAGNLDGYLIIPMTQFGDKFTVNEIKTNWGGHVKNYSNRAVCFTLKEGFLNGKGFYGGDVFFVEDANKFRQYHCPHVDETVGSAVAPTCNTEGYTPVTCKACENVEKTALVATVPCNQDIPLGKCEPTCTLPGMSSGAKCSWCNQYSLVNDWVDPLGHDMKSGKKVAPTCDEDGYTIYNCARNCGHTENREKVNKLGHAKVVNKKVEATCQIEGYTEYVCTNPGCTLVEKGDIVAKLPHDKNIDIKAIETSCTHPGRTAGKRCSMCNQVQEGYEYIWAIDHNSDAAVQALAPTCSKEGHEAGKACSKCGKVMEGCDPIKKIAHNSTYVKTVKPTDTEKGYDIYHCKDCGADEKKNYVPALSAAGGDEEYVEPDLEDPEEPEEPETEDPDPEEPETEDPKEDNNKPADKKDDGNSNLVLYIILGVVAALLLAGGAVLTIILVRKKKKV